VNRKQSIAAAILFVILLCLAGSVLAWKQWQGEPGQVGQREPLPGFGYCSSRQTRPCILAFNLDAKGSMLINVLVEASSPDFYMKVRYPEGEQTYECKRARKYSIHVTCTGELMPVGKTLSFLMLSKETNLILSEGSFPIIGVALATPEISMTPTPFTHHGPH
jgi:hypothetical protein